MRKIVSIVIFFIFMYGTLFSSSVIIEFNISGTGRVPVWTSNRYFESLLYSTSQKNVRIDIEEPHLLFFSDTYQTPVLIYPGEHIVISGSFQHIKIVVQGNEQRTKEANALVTMSKKSGCFIGQRSNESLPIYFHNYGQKDEVYFKNAGKHLNNKYQGLEERNNELSKVYNSRLVYLSGLLSSGYLSDTSYRYLCNFFKFGYLESLFRGVLLSEIPDIPDIKIIEAEFLKSISDNLLNLHTFRTCLVSFLKYKAKYYYKEFSYECIASVALDILKSESRDWVLCYCLNVIEDSTIEQSNTISYLLSNIKETKYRNIAIDRRANASIVNGADSLLNKYGAKAVVLDSLIFNNKSVLLLDFWASWCLPCIEEFPYSKKIQEKFREQPFSIVYVSMDKDVNSWFRYLKSNPEIFNSSNAYLLKGNFQAPFSQRNAISSIPRYMLVKDGKIVNSNAPRPSDPKLARMINKLLTRK